jgi:hypothetical protein
MQRLILFVRFPSCQVQVKMNSLCGIGMLEFSFPHGIIKQELFLTNSRVLFFIARECLDDLFAPIAYLLVHQDCKVPQSLALMPAQSVKPLSLPPLRKDE